MASGDVVYDESGFSVYHSEDDVVSGWKVGATLNKGGTTANTRQNVTLESYSGSPTAGSPSDINKQYQVTIKEV